MPENRLSRFKHRQQNGGMCLWCYYEGISTPGKMKNVPDHKHIVHLSTSHKQSKWWKTNKFASCCIVVLLVSADENDQNALIAVMFLLSLVYHIQALSQSESTDQDKIVDENTGPHEVKFFLQDSVAQLLPLRSCVRFSRCQLMWKESFNALPKVVGFFRLLRSARRKPTTFGRVLTDSSRVSEALGSSNTEKVLAENRTRNGTSALTTAPPKPLQISAWLLTHDVCI